MKSLKFFLLLLFLFPITTNAASFERVQPNDLNSPALKAFAQKIKKIHKLSPIANGDTTSHWVDSVKVTFKDGQTELKMVRQFLHYSAGFPTDTLEAEKLDKNLAESVRFGFYEPSDLPDAEENFDQQVFIESVYNIAELVEWEVQVHGLIFYKGTYSGSGAHEQMTNSWILLDKETKELLFVTTTYSA